MRVLITAAGGELARPTALSLRRADSRLFIVAVDVEPIYLPLITADKRYLVPGAARRDYIKAINTICLKEQIDFIVPQSDIEILVLGKNRSKLKAKMWLPSQDVIETCRDKFATQRQLDSQGVPVPETMLAQPFANVARLLKKHQQVWLRAMVGSGGIGAKLVDSQLAAKRWLVKFPKETSFTAAQYLPGRIYAWNSVWRRGKLILWQAVERIRYHKTHDSVTTLGVGTSVIRTTGKGEVAKIGKAAIRAIDPEPDGIYAVDMTENGQGVPCVTEINAGRFVTTSTMLLEKAGCFFPWYAIQIFRGKPIPVKKRFNPIKPNLYLVGGRIADPVLVGEKEIKIPVWKSILKQ